MSDYDQVRRQLLSLRDAVMGKGATETDIGALTNAWGPLLTDFKRYLEDFGWLQAGSYELFGLGDDTPAHLNLLDRSRELWNGDGIYKIPRELLPVYDSGGGWFYCLSKFHRGQPVVCWASEYEEAGEPQPFDERYESWSAWVADHVLPYVT